VRRLERIEAQEEAAAKSEKGAAAESAIERMRRYCGEFDDPDCDNGDFSQPGRNVTGPPQRETLPPNPQERLPLSAAAPILHAEAGLGSQEMSGAGGAGGSGGMSGMSGLSGLGGTSSLGGSSESGASLQGVSSVTGQSGGASPSGNVPSEAMG